MQLNNFVFYIAFNKWSWSLFKKDKYIHKWKRSYNDIQNNYRIDANWLRESSPKSDTSFLEAEKIMFPHKQFIHTARHFEF